MGKYRKKPVVIEAVQFTRNNIKEIEAFTKGSLRNITIERRIDGKYYGYIDTLGGTVRANEGDYIIKDISGEFYPCKPDIFEQAYERVD